MTNALALDNRALQVLIRPQRIEIPTHFTGTPVEVSSNTSRYRQPQNLQNSAACSSHPINQRSRTTLRRHRRRRSPSGPAAEPLNAQGRTPLQNAHFLILCCSACYRRRPPAARKNCRDGLDKSNPTSKAQIRLTELSTPCPVAAISRWKPSYFTCGLFEQIEVPPLTTEDVVQLLDAARNGLGQIEPAILATLFERGLNPDIRSQLGAPLLRPRHHPQVDRPVIESPLLAEGRPSKCDRRAAEKTTGRQGTRRTHEAHAALITSTSGQGLPLLVPASQRQLPLPLR